MPITFIIGFVILILIFSFAFIDKKNWVFFLLIAAFWTGMFLYTDGCVEIGRTAGAKGLLKGDLEPHYIYEDSICIDTIIKEKKHDKN